jgi:ATP-dependent Clp protease ATP-binding subunit ClpC
MNESALTRLKIIVERAVRPVQASMPRKRQMREELLAHVCGVFEEEAARLGDERVALERVALRFGNPAEVTGQLQESVPASDILRRYWEGRPGEPAFRTAIRLAWASGAFSLVIAGFLLVVAWITVGSVGAWPRVALYQSICAVLAMPAWLAGLVLLTGFMEKALYGPAGRSRRKVALVVAGSWLFMLVWLAAATWPTWSAGGDDPGSAVWMVCLFLVVSAFCLPWALAQSSHQRRQYLEEWACLDVA